MPSGRGIRIGFQVWGQYAEWAELRDLAGRLEDAGFDSGWSNDHFYPVDPLDSTAEGSFNLQGPVHEGWMLLAAWASLTKRVRLGCLVSGAGYRNPGLLAKMAVTLDHAAGGRAILGLGAGWHEREHRAFGFEFPAIAGRLERLDESAALIRSLLDGETVTADGRWVRAETLRLDPAPVQARLPLLIGGSGERKTLRTVARFADMWNGEGDVETIRHKSRVLDDHCAAVGRDPSIIRRTVGLPPALIRSTRDEAQADLARILSRHTGSIDETVVARRFPFAATAEEVAQRLSGYISAGVEEAVFDLPTPPDRTTLGVLAELRQTLIPAG